MTVGRASRRVAGEAYAGGPLVGGAGKADFEVGHFRIRWTGCQVLVAPLERPEHVVWRSVPGTSFLTVGIGEAKVSESRGFFAICEKLRCVARAQIVEKLEPGEGFLKLVGRFADQKESSWSLCFSALDDRQLALEASASIKGNPCNRLCIVAASHAEEEMFGFGAQFTHSYMKGRRVPVLCQEPGIGRGIQPLTAVMKAVAKAGGNWWNSYAPVPMVLTTELRGFCLENCEYSVFDMRPRDCLRVGAFTEALRGRIFWGGDPCGLLEAYTRFCGRMRQLPSWVQSGAIIGMQGGTAAVRETLRSLEESGASVVAFWLQDWVGKRRTAIGSQLWWTWELDREQYPEWEALVEELKSKGIRILTYLNPFVVDPGGKRKLNVNMHEEASRSGYFVRGSDGRPYSVKNTTFSASMLDLTNPECRSWFKEAIKEHTLGIGSSGWMADYAEALPFDAQLHSSQDAAAFHNEYPIEWAKVNREAIAEAGMEEEALFFTRSGYHCSPGHSTCFWLGDQLTSWRQEDGIKSVVVGLVSSGLSGMTISHGDIGGYTTTHVLPFHVPYVSYSRSKELLLRWIELSAFTAIFRTHEGNKPQRNHQITDDEDTMKCFARFSRIYGALAKYRAALCAEAQERGLPMVRHPWIHYPEDKQVHRLELQFLLGREFMVAPALDRKCKSVRLYLPAGTWVHLWSHQKVVSSNVLGGAGGGWFHCLAPLGFPPVFFRAQAEAGRALATALATSGDLGPAWSETACAPESPAAGLGSPARKRSWSLPGRSLLSRRKSSPAGNLASKSPSSTPSVAWASGTSSLPPEPPQEPMSPLSPKSVTSSEWEAEMQPQRLAYDDPATSPGGPAVRTLCGQGDSSEDELR